MRYVEHPPRMGFSLLEAVVSVALVGLLLVAALRTVGMSLRTQGESAQATAARFLANALMDEILRKAYEEPSGPRPLGPDASERTTAKTDFDDVDDYHRWTESPPQDETGTAIAGFDAWQRRVEVDWVSASTPTVRENAETGAKRIVVEVCRGTTVLARREALRTAAP